MEYGRLLNWEDEDQVRRVCLVGADMAHQLFGSRNALGGRLTLNGMSYTVVGRLRKKNQDSNTAALTTTRSCSVRGDAARDLPRLDAPAGTASQITLGPHPWVVAMLPAVLDSRTSRVADIEWPLEAEVRAVLASRHSFDPRDREAIFIWDTTLSTLMFGRIIDQRGRFFAIVGLVTLALGGIGLMNIMLIAVRERTREIG